MADSQGRESRRGWLLRSLRVVIGATVVAIFYPVIWFLRPRAGKQSSTAEMVAPYTADQLKPDAEGRWPPPFNFAGKPCLLVRTPDGEVRAFNAICTHLSCTVEFRPAQPDIFCNCHNGVFNLSGRNVAGPPPRPLEQYQVSLRGTPGKEEIVVSRSA